MIVSTDNLNLRKTPEIKNGNIILSLPLAHEVTVIEQNGGNRFWKVQTTVNGETKEGYISSLYLRNPVSDAKENVIKAAVNEWTRFKKGKEKENVDPYYKIVGEYWRAINLNLDGRDRDQPWSAAFISFVVRKANYSNFKFSAAHAKYILDAKEKRIANQAAPFWLFRLNEHRPQLGDLVCKWREKKRTFDDIPSGGFKSHTDVIVEISDQFVRTLGGNVAHSVSMSTFQLNGNGYLSDKNNVFAIMKNNL